MRLLVFSFLFFLLSENAYSQYPANPPIPINHSGRVGLPDFEQLVKGIGSLKKFRQKKKTYALYCIEHLKEGALLVRLKTREKSIDAYRQAGKDNIADRVEQKQYEKNLKIVNGFRENFTFCPVYFFFSNHTKLLPSTRSGIFLNDSLQVDSSIVRKEDFYMIAEFDILREESLEFPPYDSLETPTQSVSSRLNDVLVIKDEYFVQMRRPFPYYTRTSFDAFMADKIYWLDERLFRFYEKRNSKSYLIWKSLYFSP